MNKTAKSFGIVTSFSVATRLASFIFKMWMSRSLGAEIVGLYQIALSTLLMLFTITAGAPTVLSRKIAEASGNLQKQNSLATASMIMGFCISAAICALFFGLGKKIAPLFSNPDCLPIFFIMLPTLLTSTLYASLRSWFWGRKKFVAFSSTELVDEIVKIVLSIVFTGGLLSWLDGAQSIALAMTISDLACVVILIILFFLSGGRLTKPSGFKDLTLKTIPLSATRIITSLGASLTAYILPKMLVKSGLTLAEATAQYGRVSGMALPLIMAPVAFISALSVVFVPDVAESRSKGDMDAVRAKMATSMLFAIVIACLFFCGLFAARAKPRLASFQRQRGGQVRVLLFVYALSNRHGASDHAYAKLARQRAKHTSQHDCGSGGNDSVRAVYAKIHRRVRNGALNRHLLFAHCDFKSDSPQKRSRLVYQPQEKRAYDFAFRSACRYGTFRGETALQLCRLYHRNRGCGRVRTFLFLPHSIRFQRG